MTKSIICIIATVLLLAFTVSTALVVNAEETKGLLRGDVDSNGIINSTDALAVLKYAVGSNQNIDTTLADVNIDSKINSIDALLILQYSVGRITSFENNQTESTKPVKKLLYYYEDGTTGYEPKPGAKCQRSDGSWNVLPEGKIVLEYEDGSLGYVYKPNAVYFDSLDVDPDVEVLFHYEDGTYGYEPKPGASYKASYGLWVPMAWSNDFFNLTDEEFREIMEEANKYCEHCGREDCLRFWINGDECPDCGVFVPVDVCHHCS